MKKTAMTFAVLILGFSIAHAETKILTVYTYESMSWITEKAVPEFEKRNSCKVKILKFSDAGNIVSRLRLEKNKPSADCAIGLTQPLVILAKKNGIIEKYRSKNLSLISRKDIIFDADYAAPYDYGALAFVYSPEKIKDKPVSFNDITSLKRAVILQDPRASSTGQDFLLWTIAAYGDGWHDFWRKLKPSILTVAPDWGSAFAKFEAGEAPVMLSYATDGAYAWHNYKSAKYSAFIPSEGGYVQIEAGCVVKGTRQRELAERFVDFMLEDTVQREIPLNQWMFPSSDTALPDAYKYAVRPQKILRLSEKEISDNLEKWLKEWEDLIR
ncbi:MAG: thiamine ABC transporter substrate-binding protein [Spirochaetota bacterium]